MANKVSTWFKALSNTGKVVVLGAAGTGLLVTSAVAMNGTETPPPPQPPKPAIVVKDEVVRTEAIAFESQEVPDSTSPSGTRVVVTEGVNGEKMFTDKVEYTDGKETKRTPQPEQITKQSIAKVTKVGTYVAPPPPPSNCNPNYSGCVPNASDVDCAGGSGNGPAYTGRTTVIGTDVYGLDRDGDGVACEG